LAGQLTKATEELGTALLIDRETPSSKNDALSLRQWTASPQQNTRLESQACRDSSHSRESTI